MAGKGIRVDGVDELRRQLTTLPERVRAALRDATAASAAGVEAAEKAAMPVDTGAARAGVQTRMAGDGLDADVGVFDPDLDYVTYLEFGTSAMPAQPWATPAVEAERARLPGRITSAVNSRLR